MPLGGGVPQQQQREFVIGNAKQYMPVFWAIKREVNAYEVILGDVIKVRNSKGGF
jgi:hypothetical protein